MPLCDLVDARSAHQGQRHSTSTQQTSKNLTDSPQAPLRHLFLGNSGLQVQGLVLGGDVAGLSGLFGIRTKCFLRRPMKIPLNAQAQHRMPPSFDFRY